MMATGDVKGPSHHRASQPLCLCAVIAGRPTLQPCVPLEATAGSKTYMFLPPASLLLSLTKMQDASSTPEITRRVNFSRYVLVRQFNMRQRV